MPKTTTIKRGRDAESGQFVPIEYANKHPKTTVVETIKIISDDCSHVFCEVVLAEPLELPDICFECL